LQKKHPLTGAIYEDLGEGRVRVSEGDRSGVYDQQGRCVEGDAFDVDPHLITYIGGPPLRSRPSDRPRVRTRKGPKHVPPQLGKSARGSRSNDMDLGLSGKKAVVTAASKGIGLAIAQTLADEGVDVAICARSESGLESAAKDLEARGAKVFTQSVDVGDGDALRAFVEASAEALGGLDILVCNASAGSGQGEESWQANLDVDVLGSVRATEAAVPHLAASEGGSVVFISSTAALEYLGVPQSYNAMKAALLAHANDLSQSLAPQGIRVNSVSPGPIFFEGGNWEMIKNVVPPVYENALSQCAIGRMGTPEEVARAVVFLASPAASLVTGANLVADGGFTKRVAY
jgi:NAD(P)-dependent dehydrogenase (short-subunit alcohol dehydrogenase family)